MAYVCSVGQILASLLHAFVRFMFLTASMTFKQNQLCIHIISAFSIVAVSKISSEK